MGSMYRENGEKPKAFC